MDDTSTTVTDDTVWVFTSYPDRSTTYVTREMTDEDRRQIAEDVRLERMLDAAN
jgi:hypothetical protein